MIKERKKSNTSRTNLTISIIFHSVLIVLAFVLAAKTGLIPKKYIPISLMKPEEKKPEPPKPEPPKPAAPKPEEPKTSAPPKVQPASAPPPANDTPAMAPAAAVVSGFQFGDGAKDVIDMASDPRSIYKALVEHTLRTHWNRPEDMDDEKYVAEVELTIDPKGNIKDYRWVRGSGNPRWDNTVKAVLADTKAISKAPPKNFPEKFLARFDVESMRGEEIQLSSSR